MIAYKFAMFFILFALACPVVGALGVFEGVPIGETIIPPSWDWMTLVTTAVGALALVGSLIFKMPLGAAVFAGVFTGTQLPINATMNLLVSSYGLMPEIKTLMMTAISFMFLFGFIELSSAYVGD